MITQPFKVQPHNAHYEGDYSQQEVEWLRLCASDKAEHLQRLLGARQVSSLLEVGCGTGVVLATLASLKVGEKYVGVDMSDPHVHLDTVAKTFEISQYDGDTLPFSDNSFDLVYATHVVEHVPHPRLLLNEMSRVAKHFIYVEVPCELHMRTTHNDLQRTLDIGHINAYSPESFILLLQTSGLTILESELFDHSLDVHAFHSSRPKAIIKKFLRGTLRSVNKRWAAQTFTYHFGVLCEPT